MKKFGKFAVVLLLIFVLGACQNKAKEATKSDEKKVEQTTKKSTAKKKATTKTSKTQSEQPPAATQPSEQPAVNNTPTPPVAQQPIENPAPPASVGQVPIEEPVEPPGVDYSREESIHIARMTIDMSGVDASQFTEDQLYNYYDQCAQLGADYTYMLGLVAQDINRDKEELIVNYHRVQGWNDDGTTNE